MIHGVPFLCRFVPLRALCFPFPARRLSGCHLSAVPLPSIHADAFDPCGRLRAAAGIGRGRADAWAPPKQTASSSSPCVAQHKGPGSPGPSSRKDVAAARGLMGGTRRSNSVDGVVGAGPAKISFRQVPVAAGGNVIRAQGAAPPGVFRPSCRSGRKRHPHERQQSSTWPCRAQAADPPPSPPAMPRCQRWLHRCAAICVLRGFNCSSMSL